MLQPLFVPRERVKKAEPEGGQLPPDLSRWPIVIRDEFSKIAPYAWEYPVEVVLSEKHEQKGYGFGHIVVTSRTNLSPSQAMGEVGARFGTKTAKIPVIIEDWKLYPLDLLVTEEGTILPLNEERLREALFRPAVFDAPGSSGGSNMFGAVLYPPLREYGAGLGAGTATSKFGSFPVLSVVSDAVRADQVERLVDVIKTGALSEVVKRSPAVRSYLQAVNKLAAADAPITKAAALASRRSDVEMVVRAEGPTYLVKRALRGAYKPIQEKLDRGQALSRYGEERIKEADAKGVMIIIRRPMGEGGPHLMGDDEGLPEFTRGGPCQAMSTGGEDMGGWLFSKLRRLLGGGDFPGQVWTDGKKTSVQGDIGATADKSVAAPATSETPEGTGMFTWKSGDRTVTSEPVTIQAKTTMDGQSKYTGQTAMGEPISVVLSDSIQDVTHNGQDVLIPASARWVRLGDEQVSLASRKEAAARRYTKLATDKCQVRYSERQFHFDGPPLRKLGALRGLSAMEALYTCGLIGMSKEAGEKALAVAYREGYATIAGVPPITTFDEFSKVASTRDEEWSKLEITTPFLVKEAASLGDPQMVDVVLSLGFLNLDNVARAVTFSPHLEQAQRKLGILLLMARLGMMEVPQDHISRALTAIEHVLSGLRRVSLRLAPTGATV